jgi:Cactus-binding C-terminus of cactin protein/Conserved mid region of cactin
MEKDSGNDSASEINRNDNKTFGKSKSSKHRSGSRSENGSDSFSENDATKRPKRSRSERTKRSKSKKHSHSHKSKKRSKRRYHSSSSSSSDSSTVSDRRSRMARSKLVEEQSSKSSLDVNQRLLEKLAARGETLEERNHRRSLKRADRIKSTLGYTPDDNPFNDPNLHETFTWKKRDAQKGKSNNDADVSKNLLQEIEKVRKRRKDREVEFEEMERIRAEEARMKELENYDEWARKEEEFHLQQQRQRSAIRLTEGREKPIDVLAKNILIFGLSDNEKERRAAVKYQEKYNALDAVEDLEAELEEPHSLLRMLKLVELNELLSDIIAFQKLEHEASGHDGAIVPKQNVALQYWDNLRIVAEDEIEFLKSGGEHGKHASMVKDIQNIFAGNLSRTDLMSMRDEIDRKLQLHLTDANAVESDFDRNYWLFVQQQSLVHLAKIELSEFHSKMLVRQLEKLEARKELLTATRTTPNETKSYWKPSSAATRNNDDNATDHQQDRTDDLVDLEEELGLDSEYDLSRNGAAPTYNWHDKYRPRKPRYFNRVKTGYDWNKYNQTHYDKDNPPPKTVQGYKFNIFYPDLIDRTMTPQFRLEPTNTDGFCIIRFVAGPPYEDIAFKIINREWNRSRKRGFKCTFERGVLSLYFNFTTHWYRK